jgi:hypothetical protein
MQAQKSDVSSVTEEFRGILISYRLIRLPSQRNWVNSNGKRCYLAGHGLRAAYRLAELELVAGGSVKGTI